MNQKDSGVKRAVKGDEVWVLLNQVKADQWEVHKNFLLNILVPAASKVVPTEMGNTRFLFPNEPNEDGTFTSVFLMDPVVENGNYSILDILKRAYGEIQGEEYYKLWTDPLVTDQVGYRVIQSS